MQGTLLENESLAEYTTWRVGGKAKHLYKPANIADLQAFLSELPKDEPVLWLGLGSNSLISDKGYAGTVIVTQGALTALTSLSSNVIRAEAGVACAQMARACARLSLSGVEFLAGIPGTIGGALRMNAGCFNGETWNFVTAVETINRDGKITLRNKAEFEIGYRHVAGLKENEWFIAGHFELPSGEKQQSLEMIRQLLERRAATQPTSQANCGSVFRNPPGDYAARLIEAAGLKGYRCGGASVSEKHANFIINDQDATATDIKKVIEHVKNTVEKQHGIALIQEVHIIGDN